MGTTSWVPPALLTLTYSGGFGEGPLGRAKANPTHNSGPTPSLKKLSLSLRGSCPHPKLTSPFRGRAPPGCPQALNMFHCH